jgi:hypothetical protein
LAGLTKLQKEFEMTSMKACFVGLLGMLSGCANTGLTSATGTGFLYQSNVEAVSTTGLVLGDGAGTGVSCAHHVLGAIVYGDASVDEAKRRADIREVVTVDRTYERVLGFYGRSCIIVRGN